MSSTETTPDAPTREERRTFLAEWAAKHTVALELEGECGFGRECVGFTKGSGYLDYDHVYETYGPENYHTFWVPEDAYHKHPCMAVLGRGEKAEAQLYAWAKWLDANGWGVETGSRWPANYMDALLNGVRTTRLVKLDASSDGPR